MSEAQEFLQPIIESNNYWVYQIEKVGIIFGIIALSLIILNIIKTHNGNYSKFLYLTFIFSVIVSALAFMCIIIIQCENIQMTKFPQSEYNKIKRTIGIGPLI